MADSSNSSQHQSGAGSPQQFCLRWNNYQTNLTNVFDQLLQSESFVDVTLACDGHSVKAHKMVLSACSPYFQALFFDNPCQHPIVIMKDVKWPELKAAVEFMYKGEINVSQDQIGPLLKVAESLKIRGLADVSSEHELTSRPSLEESLNLAVAASGGSSAPARASKKRRMTSGDRSPSQTAVGCSPERNAGNERDEQDSASTGHDSHGLNSSSTPRSLGSPSVPSISVTPQISLHEMPVSLSLPPPPMQPPTPHGQSAGGAGGGHHVSVGHVGSAGAGSHTPVNHLSAHSVAQQLSVAQHQQQAAHHHHQQQQHHHHQTNQGGQPSLTDDDIKPGIAEMIREEERAKLLESSHAWLGASTSSIAADYTSLLS
ncbi:protein bric-a-brac 1-like isoform X2 [Copidosoma floridanum]|uniref:protein bric-a-brac 1-like isoform X2 n=1 Tax=Copidosoma floridanum TaxID=29053 RepID=UPI0006C952AB|nr:protein bric-a-brac 1-like isoform X2 [Copidosoma floridanum]